MSPRSPARFHGFLVIDKPAGLTSHDVVSRVRRLAGQRSVGHAGTLDPAATGVLPLALGDATRVLRALDDRSKTYLAEITFGVETDTLDADGRVVVTADPSGLTEDRLAPILTTFIGDIDQVAPRYSAVQVGGKRLYDLARQGADFEPPSRQVHISDLQVIRYDPPTLTLCIDCGSGTYIRSLAADIGRLAGCGAYLSNLVRLRAGSFTIADAWQLEHLESLAFEHHWSSVAYHPDEGILSMPAVILDEANHRRWSSGQLVRGDTLKTGTRFRAYTAEGVWIGLGDIAYVDHQQMIQPRTVTSPALAPV